MTWTGAIVPDISSVPMMFTNQTSIRDMVVVEGRNGVKCSNLHTDIGTVRISMLNASDGKRDRPASRSFFALFLAGDSNRCQLGQRSEL